jgi:hypothetical protein
MRGQLIRAVALAFGCLLAVATPVAASDITLTIGSPSLSKSRVAVTVPLTVTCQPLDPTFDLVIETVTARVDQAAGQRIATGSASRTGSPSELFACDGASHIVAVTLLADTSGPPFHGGQASVLASVEVQAGVETCGPGCGSIYYDVTATAGPVDRNLR